MRSIKATITGVVIFIFAFAVFSGCAHKTKDYAWYLDENEKIVEHFEYEEVQITSQYITMRDGVKIAIDLYLPKGLEQGKKIPAIMMQTRYVRAMEFKKPFHVMLHGRYDSTIEYFIKHGYAWVYVDARGSGASFGTRPHPYSDAETKDGAEIASWIAKQPWSNGKIGLWGNSYDAGSLLYMLTNRHQAVKAAMPRFAMFDSYSEVVFPGGIHLVWLTDIWGRLAKALDKNKIWEFIGNEAKLAVKGTKPVDEDEDREQLAEAVKQHVTNGNIKKLPEGIVFRDDPSPMDNEIKVDDISPAAIMTEINSANVPTYFYSGWFDAAFVLSEIHLFMNSTIDNKKLTLGPWDHGGWTNISHYARKKKPYFDSDYESKRFFDRYLKDVNNNIDKEKPVHYYTLGEGKWKSADTWPPKGGVTVPMYFGENNTLKKEKPKNHHGYDEYKVTYDTGTGKTSRWVSLVNIKHKKIQYKHRKREDNKLLVYDSAPLQKNMEVTGHPVVYLQVTSTADDGNFFVYLEDIDEKGKVHYVTEGMLRAIHRKVSNDKAPYITPVPYRTFLREDAMPLVKNEVAELEFALLPVSYQFKKGHKIRISIAGADKDHFVNNPEEPPTIRMYRNSVYPSRIDLPVMK